MSILDFFRKSPTEPSTTRHKVRDEPGPLTAHQAWEIVQPVVHSLDHQARLTFISSGLDISREGRSFAWEFGFELPGRRSYALLSLEPSEEGGDIDDAPIFLVQRLRPMPKAEAGRRPVFPERFKDSPEAVAELAAQGVDFVAGPSDMKLEGRVLSSGETVWLTYYWDEERTTPFGIAAN